MTRKIKRVEIEWFDTSSPDDCTSQFCLDEMRSWEPLRMASMGFLIGKNDSGTAYILAANCSEGAMFRQVTVIPVVNVVKIRRWKS